MATDNFTGTDGDQLPTYNVRWTQNRGGAAILTNAYRGTTTSHHCHHDNAEVYTDDQLSEVELVALVSSSHYIGPVTRADTGGLETFYLFDTNLNGDSYLVLYDGGTPTTLANVSDGTRTVGDRLLLDNTGTTLDPQINDVTAAMGTRVNVVISSGAAGVGGFNNNTGARGDNWEGLSLGVGGVVTLHQTTNYQGMNRMNGAMR